MWRNIISAKLLIILTKKKEKFYIVLSYFSQVYMLDPKKKTYTCTMTFQNFCTIQHTKIASPTHHQNHPFPSFRTSWKFLWTACVIGGDWMRRDHITGFITCLIIAQYTLCCQFLFLQSHPKVCSIERIPMAQPNTCLTQKNNTTPIPSLLLEDPYLLKLYTTNGHPHHLSYPISCHHSKIDNHI